MLLSEEEYEDENEVAVGVENEMPEPSQCNDDENFIEKSAERLAAALRAAAGEGSSQPVVLLPAARS